MSRSEDAGSWQQSTTSSGDLLKTRFCPALWLSYPGWMLQPSQTYTHGHHESVLRSHLWRTAGNSAAYLLPYLEPGMNLLDIGCGPGNLTVDLAQHVAPGRVIGLDAAAEVIDLARSTSETSADVEFVVGDAYHLQFDDETFDVVHAHQVLQHLSDPVAALVEMSRVTKPGGIVAVRDADYGAMTWYPDNPALDRWLDVCQAVVRSTGGEPDAGRRLLSWALQAGFPEVTPTASVWCFANPTNRAWWGGLWADRVLSSALARQAVDGGFAEPADLEEIAAAWRQWADQPDGWFAGPHGELICRKASA
jgi:SAM-dependent methyltransferase